MRGLLLPRECSLHTAKESPRRRKQILDTVARSQGVSALTIRHRRRPGTDRIDGRPAAASGGHHLTVGSRRQLTSWTTALMRVLVSRASRMLSRAVRSSGVSSAAWARCSARPGSSTRKGRRGAPSTAR